MAGAAPKSISATAAPNPSGPGAVHLKLPRARSIGTVVASMACRRFPGTPLSSPAHHRSEPAAPGHRPRPRLPARQRPLRRQRTRHALRGRRARRRSPAADRGDQAPPSLDFYGPNGPGYQLPKHVFDSIGGGGDRAPDDGGADGGAMNDELNPQAPQTPQDNPEKDPEDWVTGDEPMTGPQRSYLQTLAREADREGDLDALPQAGAAAGASRVTVERQAGGPARVGGTQRVFHLHRLDDREQLPGGRLVAVGDVDPDHGALHRGADRIAGLGQTRHVDPEPAAADADRHPSVLRALRSGRRRGGQGVLLDPAGVDGGAVRAVQGGSGAGKA